MKKFDPDYALLKDMYADSYYPPFLTDKIKALIQMVISYLEAGSHPVAAIQQQLDAMTVGINELQDEFDGHDSEIETVARESIGATVDYILTWFEVPVNIETAIGKRDW